MLLQQMGKGRAVQESAVEWTLWALVGAPWAGYREAWGMQSWKGESQSPWLCTVLSVPSGAHARADQISLCSSCTKSP